MPGSPLTFGSEGEGRFAEVWALNDSGLGRCEVGSQAGLDHCSRADSGRRESRTRMRCVWGPRGAPCATSSSGGW
jgi:hypothetical protein